MTLEPFVLLAAALFLIGLFGVLTRRNIVGILMGLELMFNAANINFIVASYFMPKIVGTIFAIFVLLLAAVEVAVGVALLLAYFRSAHDIDIDKMYLLRSKSYD